MKRFLALSLVPLLASAAPALFDRSRDDGAPILSTAHTEEIPDSYMIVFKNDVPHTAATEHHDWVQKLHVEVEMTKKKKRDLTQYALTAFEGLKHTYNIPGGLLGYSGQFDKEVIESVRKHPHVAYIEKDSVVHTTDSSDDDHPETEINAPWGLARISHRNRLSFGTFNKYLYSDNGGEGVDVYVIDTGTNFEHVDFEGRAHWGKTIPDNEVDEDGNGHGTHCSGTIAGKKFGVAKKANVYAVKVLRSNGSGSMSDVVKGVEWTALSHQNKVKEAKAGNTKKVFKGSVANMSLGGGQSSTLDLAVNAAVDVGIHFAVAAGNDNANSCSYSPARAEKAITVGATTLADERAYFSNYGKCNDIFAPGLNILSTWTGSQYATKTISGTSMASPHIAGLLAYLLSLQPSKQSGFAVDAITPVQLKKSLIAIGTVGTITDVPADTENILAWNGGGSSNLTEIFGQPNLEKEYTILPVIDSFKPEFNAASQIFEQELK